MLPLKSLDRDKGINLAQADPMGRAPEDQNLETQSTFPISFCPGIQLVGLFDCCTSPPNAIAEV
jgi:hypothetical protein